MKIEKTNKTKTNK